MKISEYVNKDNNFIKEGDILRDSEYCESFYDGYYKEYLYEVIYDGESFYGKDINTQEVIELQYLEGLDKIN